MSLVLSLASLSVAPEYVASYILFASVYRRELTQGLEPRIAGMKALEAQKSFGEELKLSVEYIQCVEANLAVLQVGCYTRLLLMHPGF